MTIPAQFDYTLRGPACRGQWSVKSSLERAFLKDSGPLSIFKGSKLGQLLGKKAVYIARKSRRTKQTMLLCQATTKEM
jgi:hypothetical protein